jgi:hypothetical protein
MTQPHRLTTLAFTLLMLALPLASALAAEDPGAAAPAGGLGIGALVIGTAAIIAIAAAMVARSGSDES